MPCLCLLASHTNTICVGITWKDSYDMRSMLCTNVDPPWTLPFQRTNEVVVPVLNFPKEEAKKESS